MAKRLFEMNGKRFNSMAEIAKELGVTRVRPQQFDKYGIVEVSDTVEDTTEDTTEDATVSKDSDKKTEKKSEKTGKKVYTVDELVKGSIEEFSKNLRKVPTDEVIKFALDNTDGFDAHYAAGNDNIRRMKAVMCIKEKFFAGQSIEHKKSGFRKESVEDLMKFADSVGVAYTTNKDARIQKMWVTHALTQAGYNEIPKKVEDNNGN